MGAVASWQREYPLNLRTLIMLVEIAYVLIEKGRFA